MPRHRSANTPTRSPARPRYGSPCRRKALPGESTPVWSAWRQTGRWDDLYRRPRHKIARRSLQSRPSILAPLHLPHFRRRRKAFERRREDGVGFGRAGGRFQSFASASAPRRPKKRPPCRLAMSTALRKAFPAAARLTLKQISPRKRKRKASYWRSPVSRVSASASSILSTRRRSLLPRLPSRRATPSTTALILRLCLLYARRAMARPSL